MQTTFEIRPDDPLLPQSPVATTARGNARLRKAMFDAALALAPVAIGAGTALFARSRRAGVATGAVTALGLALVRWQLVRSFKEQPDYEVEERLGRVEIRCYDERVEAETLVGEDDLAAAFQLGYERLAAYLGGANEHHERLAMTTPLTARIVDDGDHRIAFVMPPSRTTSTLPAPEDDRVELVEVPRRRVAVLGFRGPRSARLFARKVAELREHIAEAGYAILGGPVFAAFDPPRTLPLLRRNEVWIDVA